MADNNNNRVAELPLTPHPALQRLKPLVGTWKKRRARPWHFNIQDGFGRPLPYPRVRDNHT